MRLVLSGMDNRCSQVSIWQDGITFSNLPKYILWNISQISIPLIHLQSLLWISVAKVWTIPNNVRQWSQNECGLKFCNHHCNLLIYCPVCSLCKTVLLRSILSWMLSLNTVLGSELKEFIWHVFFSLVILKFKYLWYCLKASNAYDVLGK